MTTNLGKILGANSRMKRRIQLEPALSMIAHVCDSKLRIKPLDRGLEVFPFGMV